MERLAIQGGNPLRGIVRIGGAKNAALPIMAACLAVEGRTTLRNVPDLTDVRTLSDVLTRLGLKVIRDVDNHLTIEEGGGPRSQVADYELVRQMRASVCVLGPLLGRYGEARVALPGGCQIGHRPLDLHLKGLEALGASIRIEHGDIIASASRLRGTTIDLAGPRGSTVTGTCNLMTAAVFAEGETVIEHAAREPEVCDLAEFLRDCGAIINGHGTETIRVTGSAPLYGTDYAIIPDRIEAATFMTAVAATGGAARIEGLRLDHLESVLEWAAAAGINVKPAGPDAIHVAGGGALKACDFAARPYPGIPTDVQAQLSAILCTAPGTSVVVDTVFPDRFLHVPELQRMGAKIEREGNRIRITGVSRLSGTAVRATDLRASAALVIAGLAAEGTTVIDDLPHLDRGYDHLDRKLRSLGAKVARVSVEL